MFPRHSIMETLISEYKKKKQQIKKSLKEFRGLRNAKDEDIFQELCFCILTPQTKALFCDKAVKDLRKSGLLFKGDKDTISKRLKGKVRFHNNKAEYIIAARKLFKNGRTFDIKNKLDMSDVLKIRNWLVKNVKGLGYKEASHFLRNVGLGKDIAIIDRHVLENLKKYRLINEIPSSISKKKYIDIENEIRKFSYRVKIPLEELDLLFWSKQTGFIFK